jgi:hypothetical protein
MTHPRISILAQVAENYNTNRLDCNQVFGSALAETVQVPACWSRVLFSIRADLEPSNRLMSSAQYATTWAT